jgi:DNA-binding CsgD family transcriptional regulator
VDLFGRTEERRTIDLALEGARSGRSCVLVLAGEPGIGKSTLLAYAAEQAAGMRVLRAAGVESEVELPFAGLHQLLWPVLQHVEVLAAPQASALRGAFGLETAPGDRFLVAVALLTLLAEVAEERPLLVLVDDVHWLDAPSAEALAFAARRLGAEAIVMLFAVRNGEPRHVAASGLPHLALAGLDGEAASLLLRAGADGIAPAVRDRLLAETAGNPLALVELPGTLVPDQLAGRRPLPAELPLTARLQQAYVHRLRDLPDDTRRLLLVAAAEESADLGVVLAAAAALGVGPEALAGAEQARLLDVTQQEIRFRHPLVRSAVYQDAGLGDRLAVHRALAGVLVGEERQDRRVWHLAAATVGPDEAVAAALEASAARAEVRSGPETAMSALERAATLSESAAARARRLARAADNANSAGRRTRAETLVAQARGLTDDPAVLAQLARAQGIAEAEHATAETCVRTTLRGAGLITTLLPERAALMIAAAARTAWQEDDLGRLDGARRSLAAVPGPADAPYLQLARSCLGPSLRDGAATAPGIFDPAQRWLESTGAAPWAFPTGFLADLLGEEQAGYRLYRDLAAAVRSRGAPGDLIIALLSLGMIELVLGNWSSALADVTEAVDLARDVGYTRQVGRPLAVLGRIRGLRGEAEACRAAAGEALRTTEGLGIGVVAAQAAWAVGMLELGQGRPEEALEQLVTIAGPGAWPGRSFIALRAAGDLVEAAVRADRRDLAAEVTDAFERWAGSDGPAWTRVISLRCRGLLAGDDTAGELFEAALYVDGAARRPFELARTQLEYGQWLRRARRRRDSRVQLRTALQTFDRLGAAAWAERARAELRASGETIRRHDPSAIDQLTPQELQIARMAASGLTNREIGAQLFVSARTVGSHLYSVFPKLGVTSRAELRQAVLDQALPV